ncbi:hypothetical protein AB0M29_43345 [Streptomyces sp. NPDC051976]|uniref:hypothetical protein n=1 Tax=Streptomyces sp. NPDC051976 TaxID=3154947 RepID=UPI00342E5608
MPGIEPLTAAAAAEGLRPDQVTRFIEAALTDWNHQYEFAHEPALRIALDFPVDLALHFGYLTAEEQTQVRTDARAATLRRMDKIVDALADDGLDEHQLRQLREARGSTRAFRRLVSQYDKRLGSSFRTAGSLEVARTVGGRRTPQRRFRRPRASPHHLGLA